jgi:hypothetical protein
LEGVDKFMENIIIMKLEKKAQEKYLELESKVDEVKFKLYKALEEDEEFIDELAFIEFCIDYFKFDLGLENEEMDNYLTSIVNKIRELKYHEIKLKVVKEMYLEGDRISDCKVIKLRNEQGDNLWEN